MPATACFIGLGNMGMPMAMNLLQNGVKLFVYNRSKEKAIKLIEEGAALLDSPRDAFDYAKIVFSMVSDDEALRSITLGSDGILAKSQPGFIHISMSTVSPELSRTLAANHEEKGVYYIAAPVFGRPEAAAQQNLWICMAGNSKAKQEIEPLLHFLGKKTYDFGDDPSKANAIKVAGNFMVLSIVELLSETFAFAEKGGIPLETIHSFLTDSLFPSPVFQNYGRLIINQNFSPAGFKMSLGLKDINLFLQAAGALRSSLPVAELLHKRLENGIEHEHSELDWSAISLAVFEEAGLVKTK